MIQVAVNIRYVIRDSLECATGIVNIFDVRFKVILLVVNVCFVTQIGALLLREAVNVRYVYSKRTLRRYRSCKFILCEFKGNISC